MPSHPFGLIVDEESTTYTQSILTAIVNHTITIVVSGIAHGKAWFIFIK